MTALGILLITLSAALHAGWNLMCKSRHPSGAFFLMASLASICALLPGLYWFAPVIPHIPGKIWLLLAVTGAAQAAYYVALGKAYQTIEVSVAYPLARALPVILIPITTTLLALGQPLNGMAVAGMTVVALGCALLPMQPMKRFSLQSAFRNGFGYVVMAAGGTTAYTIIDSEAMRRLIATGCAGGKLSSSLLYVFLENLFIVPWLAVYVVCSRPERRSARLLLLGSVHYPIISGVTCTSAYTLVLAAMLLSTNVSYVMAFRQLSIPIGAVLGVVILRERVTPAKTGGILLIIAGLVVVAFR
jgi:drug/metabolite transporter (DMT)-like permease